MEFCMIFKQTFYLLLTIGLILFCKVASADYIIGQYYCYEHPYHHCVYYARPTDAVEVRHGYQPFFTQEPNYRVYRATPTYQNLDPRGFEDR